MTHGALLLDKPVGLSSNRALQEARKLLGGGKAGHAGTLDPLASGLLMVLLGEATKLAGPLLDDDKEYLATLRLGMRTATGDAEGAVLETCDIAPPAEAIEPALARFRGESEQVPPMHSALKRAGVPLYVLARRGESVAREARRVRIVELASLGYEPPHLRVRVRCSKGTYIRTLAEDIGAALGSCAHLAALRRTGCGRFRVEAALTLETLAALPAPERVRRVIGLGELLAGLPRAELDAAQEACFRNGQTLKGFPGTQSAGTALRAVFGADGRVVGLGEADSGALRPRRLLATSSQAADNHPKTL